MATQTKQDKLLLRQGVTGLTAAPAEAPEESSVAEPEAVVEPIAGARFMYGVWLVGAALLILHFLIDTLWGFLG